LPCGLLLWCGARQVLGEPVELRLPEFAVTLDPGGGVAHRRGDQGRAPHAPLAADAGEAGALEDAHVFGRRRQRHVESPRQLADRLVAGRQPREDLATDGVGERRKRGVEACVMVNHVV